MAASNRSQTYKRQSIHLKERRERQKQMDHLQWLQVEGYSTGGIIDGETPQRLNLERLIQPLKLLRAAYRLVRFATLWLEGIRY